jgi:hypothetical protein
MPTTTPIFCTDLDLLHWEPNILRDAAFASQTLISRTGDLAGTDFTIAAGSFVTAKVARDQVIVIDAPINGCFPITAINTATSLSLSILYDALIDEENDTRTAAGTTSATGVPYAVRTFWPQRVIVSELLSQAAGAGQSRDGEAPAAILDPTSLRRACALGTLQMIYSALAAAADEDEPHYAIRAELYERLFRRAMRSARVAIDLDADGEADVIRALNVLELRRT